MNDDPTDGEIAFARLIVVALFIIAALIALGYTKP